VLEVTFWSPGTDLGLILQPGEGLVKVWRQGPLSNRKVHAWKFLDIWKLTQ